jgi:hypothetical protein
VRNAGAVSARPTRLPLPGLWTIKELHLDDPGTAIERAKDSLHQQRISELSPQDQTLLKAATNNLGR